MGLGSASVCLGRHSRLLETTERAVARSTRQREKSSFSKKKKNKLKKKENSRAPRKNIQGRPWVVPFFFFVGNWTNRRISSIIPFASSFLFSPSSSYFLSVFLLHSTPQGKHFERSQKESLLLFSLFIRFFFHRLSIV